MQTAPHNQNDSPGAPVVATRGGRVAIRSAGAATCRAFTLLELLVVMGIIGLLAAVALPSLKGLGQANITAGANRQMIEDLSMARLRAIAGRTTVYMVFVPTNIWTRIAAASDPIELRQLTNLVNGQYTSYALLAKRTVGDQPGRDRSRYLTEWRTLPEGMLIAPPKFVPANTNLADPYQRGFVYQAVPFPNSTNALVNLPCIVFNPQGQLVSGVDEIISLARGSVFYARDQNNHYISQPPDVSISPPNNFTNSHIRVNWLTGRAVVERVALP